MVKEQQSIPVAALFDVAVTLADRAHADAILILAEIEIDWLSVNRLARRTKLIAACHLPELIASAARHQVPAILLDNPTATLQDKLTQALLEAVAAEHIHPGSAVVAIYAGFEDASFDSVSVIRLNERLGKLTARDLQQLGLNVPLDTLKYVVELAVDIGREGREGKPVGTMFVVGDHRRVLEHTRPAGFDFVKAYPRRERNLADPRVREGIKEIAQLDGAFVVASDGTVEASCRLVDTLPVDVTMTTGLGARHFAGAAISKNTKAIAVVVSESSGTVRIFQNGEVVLRVEPFARAMKWKGFGGAPSPRSNDEV
ncbi:MAG TPA: DNA integrity scanning protein DisA nucleotide-binding domain protein [Pirellulaceae bacterium]|nr:DNA integrity scanning protein DisA nucleotide-binding domain protein [Pirellulaceae bacterium]